MPDIFERMPEISRIGSFSFLFWAVLIGLFLAWFVNMGPAFITLVQTSLHRGGRSAAWFATGVILNDVMIVALCIITSVQVVMRTQTEAALGCIGAGVIMILFGIFTFRKKVGGGRWVLTPDASPSGEGGGMSVSEVSIPLSERRGVGGEAKPAWYVFLGKGFVLNILNPFVWLLWFSAVAIVAGKMGGNKISTIVFFAIILGTTFAMELLKAWGAVKLKRFLAPGRTTIINRIAGVLLMLCGAYFIVVKGIMQLL